MAVSFQTNKKSRGRRRTLMSDVNVTPMIDVMLVLLVIFMVTAPLLHVGVTVDLPKSNASPLSEKNDPLNVTITASGDVYIGSTQVDIATLPAKLIAITNANHEARVYIHGSKQLSYGKIIEVMGLISSAGFKKIALVADPVNTETATKKAAK